MSAGLLKTEVEGYIKSGKLQTVLLGNVQQLKEGLERKDDGQQMQDNSISHTHTVSANFFSTYVCLFLHAYKQLQQVTELAHMATGARPGYQ